MMGDFRKAAVDAEMHDEQAGGKALFPEASRAPRRIAGAMQQAIAVNQIPVRHHHIRRQGCTGRRRHPRDPSAFVTNAGNGVAQPDVSAKPFEQGHHAFDQPARAATNRPYPAALFQMMDERIDAAGLHRVAADQKSVK